MKELFPLLTEEQITEAQVAYISKHEGLSFPLHGEHRDICIKEAQRDQDLKNFVSFLGKNKSIAPTVSYKLFIIE